MGVKSEDYANSTVIWENSGNKKKQDILDYLVECEHLGKALKFQLVKSFYNGNTRCFFQHFDEFCDKKFKDIAIGTQRHYLLLRKQLKMYRKEILVEDLDYKFLSNFFHFLKCRDIGASGIGMRRKNLNTVIKYFIKNGYMESNPCSLFPKPREKQRDEFLTQEEIRLIRNCNLSLGNLTDGLEMTRNMFLFSCYTGLRFGDVVSLKKDDVKSDSIVKIMEKTKTKVVIPLTDEAKSILKKVMPKRGLVFSYRSNVSVNRDLKLISKIVNIRKRVSFHTARHTFGTLLAQKNIQPFYIMKLLKTNCFRKRDSNENPFLFVTSSAVEKFRQLKKIAVNSPT